MNIKKVDIKITEFDKLKKQMNREDWAKVVTDYWYLVDTGVKSLNEIEDVIKDARKSFVKNGYILSEFLDETEKCGLNAKEILNSEPQTYQTGTREIKEKEISFVQRAYKNIKIDKYIIDKFNNLKLYILQYPNSEDINIDKIIGINEKTDKAFKFINTTVKEFIKE